VRKGKVHPRTGHEGLDGEMTYSCTFSLTFALDGGGWSTPRPDCFAPVKETRYTFHRSGWASGKFWTGVENLAFIGIRSPERPTRGESLYRARYPGPL
jgi:hypothetical protein